MTDTNQKGEGMYHLQYLQMDDKHLQIVILHCGMHKLEQWKSDCHFGSHIMTLEHVKYGQLNSSPNVGYDIV